ncbi:hypothetical protein OUZ56_018597 [Daphnia magna]|uniref:Uncharacterized protein n=1 Tax=Daphnia magna TaxID=35525 RepID=A0ABQ9Z9B0_9CRUS|nr:hypothetical protein OUZ56_018597 [Daphnia magna]
MTPSVDEVEGVEVREVPVFSFTGGEIAEINSIKSDPIPSSVGGHKITTSAEWGVFDNKVSIIYNFV